MDVTPYIPQLLWRFWLSDADPTKHTLDDHRVHMYDVFNNLHAVDEGCLSVLRCAKQAFTRLENQVERILADLVLKIRSPGPISKRNRDRLLWYFVFLRYRNSVQYNETVGRLTRRVVVDGGGVVNARHAWHRVRRRAVLGSYHAFLHHESLDTQTFHRFEGLDCWRFCKAEICIGIASEGQKYVLPDTCFASLDEDFGGGDPTSPHLLFPMMPTLALYVLGVQGVEPPMKGISTGPPSLAGDEGTTWIDVGVESPSDVHLRNASLLQRNPAHLYFSSLMSLMQAISSYDEFRWISEHLGFSGLKQRARQKVTLEKVTKTLVVKGSVLLVDLTDEVTKVGHYPACHGGGSTRWMTPELILTLVEDDGVPPIITTESDVFSFACVCLEVRFGGLRSCAVSNHPVELVLFPSCAVQRRNKKPSGTS
ncbi:hypothetical protein BU15DRAFT_72466 [Melanogaster broomeanus]|nr:hypothetical protein BU15DRAFT_72466 [Melanogaster broomeanus]